MTRVALSLVVAVSSFGDRVTGQTFSTTADYAAFYKSRFDPRFESSSEPTIALWWTIEQFGDRNVPREKLRDYLLRHKELFRESEHAERVASFLKVIERMLDEKRPAADKKVERLIYDLRELNLRQWIHPNDGLRIFGPVHCESTTVREKKTMAPMRRSNFVTWAMTSSRCSSNILTTTR